MKRGNTYYAETEDLSLRIQVEDTEIALALFEVLRNYPHNDPRINKCQQLLADDLGFHLEIDDAENGDGA